eukprot:GDKJ01063739.1.p1 GENE.GDKJ01063739.1~~GDKJ01063739.1.p1  ORF type:complete len:251 (-),score=42.71 GDKJ01063739.1:194-946(-)
MSSEYLERISLFMNFWNTRDRVSSLVNATSNLYIAVNLVNGNKEGLGKIRMISKATDSLSTALRYAHWLKMIAQSMAHMNDFSKTKSSTMLLDAISSGATGIADVLRDASFIKQVITFQKSPPIIEKTAAVADIISLLADLIVTQRQIDVAQNMFQTCSSLDSIRKEAILREMLRLRSVRSKKVLQTAAIVLYTFVIPRVKMRDMRNKLSLFAAFLSFGAALLAVHANWNKSKTTNEIAHRIQDASLSCQ